MHITVNQLRGNRGYFLSYFVYNGWFFGGFREKFLAYKLQYNWNTILYAKTSLQRTLSAFYIRFDMCNLKFGSWNLLAFRRHICRGIAVGSGQSGWTHFGQTFGSFHSIFCRREISKHEQFLVNWHCAWHFIFHAVPIIPIITIDLWHSCTGTFRFDPDSICWSDLYAFISYIYRGLLVWIAFRRFHRSALIPIVSGTTRSLRFWPLLTNAKLRSFHYPDYVFVTLPARFRWFFEYRDNHIIHICLLSGHNSRYYTIPRSRTYFSFKTKINKQNTLILSSDWSIVQPQFLIITLSINDDPTSSSARDGPRCGLPTRSGDYICYKHVSFWSITLMTTEACVDSSFWAGTPVGTSSSIGQRVVVLEIVAEGGGGGGGGGEITTSGSPARSQSNLQRIFSGWSPPNA